MIKVKKIIVNELKQNINRYDINANIDISHGIKVSVSKEYVDIMRDILNRMLGDKIIGYHEIHYAYSDIVIFQLTYTIQS